jgi:hypothetical protein
MKSSFVVLCASLLGVLVLGGCASKGGQVASFEDLTTEAQKEGLVKVPQYRVISISGSLPFDSVGTVDFYKPQRKPSTAISLSREGTSKIIESTIEASCDQACLQNVRDKILAVKRAAARLIEARVRLTKLESSNPATDAAVLTAAGQHYDKARTALDDKHDLAVREIKDHGVIIFRWNVSTQKSGSVGLGALFGASGDRDETLSGFGLLSGIKASTLVLSTDFHDEWGSLDLKSKYANRFEVTTKTMHARHIMYMSEQDLSMSLGAHLEASYAQLANIGETIKELDKIELKAAFSQASNFANVGVIGGTTRKTINVDWTKPDILDDQSRLDDWQAIYAVKSDIKDLLDLSALMKSVPYRKPQSK